MPNITVTVDEDTYRNARVAAASKGTSVSALVRQYLTELGAGESEFERLKRLEKEMAAKVKSFSASDRLSRDEIHRRNR
ncbi:MAG: hypothetical protein JSS43_00380 [Proteobacteria bacterium]|nr:hypothetical protein [Pseudomonadota bacterium]